MVWLLIGFNLFPAQKKGKKMSIYKLPNGLVVTVRKSQSNGYHWDVYHGNPGNVDNILLIGPRIACSSEKEALEAAIFQVSLI